MISYGRIEAIFHPLYLIKNFLAFLLGVVILFVSTGKIGSIPLFAPVGFVFAYNSVYFINDLKDFEEDKLDVHKFKTKPLLNGHLNKNEAKALCLFYLITGLMLSFYSGILFGFSVLILLILNMIHTFFLKSLCFPLILNIAIMQILKISLGWLSISNSFENFPFYFMIFLGLLYSTSYLFYKRERGIVDIKPNKKILMTMFKKPINSFFSVATILSFVTSFLLYTFRLHIIVMFLIIIAFVFSVKFTNVKRISLYRTYQILIINVYASVIVSFFLMSYIPELIALNKLLLLI